MYATTQANVGSVGSLLTYYKEATNMTDMKLLIGVN